MTAVTLKHFQALSSSNIPQFKYSVITATSYSVGDKSCDMTLAANKDGSFTATCGGDKISMMPIFAPTGEGINLKLGDKKATVLRCTQ